ncbi:MAG TPA: 3-deoxy-D-manno-octulosonic acid transferase [Phenylobacterium sp.]|uniref:3-deoxy-D-manno-octulosonic acid transferase n=1 Tax=Phenylobacterium sp. TaxID=1871053 RepID=UPI002B472424|nr:3-deoxy-D-manno-octulosonic acid transferase [Phenylobacterium sp.]HKR86979.1 3-deoxy-D-manno-octulosonic acid transferase [Phenylobacterium sp.]
MRRKTRPLPLALYGAATLLLEPLAPRLLAARAAKGKEATPRLHERLGRAKRPRPAGRLVWLHAVSVGESLSLLPLIAALGRRPELALLVTSGTVTSAELLARRLPQGVIHQFAPIDAPGAVRRFLDHWRPDAGLFVESELWPNLILAARARGVKLGLISARITAASAAGWARAPASARALLGAFDLILPQDEATAGRLEALGAVTGPRLNLKRAGAAPPADEAALAGFRAQIGARPVVLAASTHPGEEPLIAEAFRAVADDRPDALLILAPRHPDRGPGLAAELAAGRWSVARRSLGETPGAGVQTYVADTLGEMGLLLRLADVVVMGGSFVDGIGGHNPLEAARLGAALVTGPHVANAEELYDEMLAEAAAIQAADASALTRHLRGLLANPQIARRMGEAALDYAERQNATLEGALPLIEDLVGS